MTDSKTTHYSKGHITPARRALEGDHQCDAVVVGAGYAGISAAMEFLRQGLSVIVVERKAVASGASGRNGGILLLSEGTHLGEADASVAVDDVLNTAVGQLTTLMLTEGIDAHTHYGSIRLATTHRQAEQLRRSANAGAPEVRKSRRFLDRSALADHVRSDRYAGGLLEPNNISLNPYRLLEGIAQVAEQQHAVIAEGDPVTNVANVPGGVVVSTSRARISASRLVVATGAGTRALVPSLRAKLLHGYSQIAVTAPLGDDLLDDILPGSEVFSEIATFSRYYRRLPEGRLLFGISTLFESIPPPELERRIRRELSDTFPTLADVTFDSVWEGEIASTREETPLLTRIGPTAVVTSSNGVLPSWYSGRIAALASAAEFAEVSQLFDTAHGSWPPLGVPAVVMRSAATAFLRFKDRL